MSTPKNKWIAQRATANNASLKLTLALSVRNPITWRTMACACHVTNHVFNAQLVPTTTAKKNATRTLSTNPHYRVSQPAKKDLTLTMALQIPQSANNAMRAVRLVLDRTATTA